MKKLTYMLMLTIALLATACAGEEDLLFSQSAAERLNSATVVYSDILTTPEGGWAILYYPTNDNPNEEDKALTTGVPYLWCVKFYKDKSVKVAMNNYFSSNVYQEDISAWDVITDNGPVLTFNSYNKNVHAFSDPDVRQIPNYDENVWGVGVGGDYEFVIVDAPADHGHVMLKGKKRGTYNLMIPLPAGTDYEQYLQEVAQFKEKYFPKGMPHEDMFAIGDEKFKITSANTFLMSMYPAEGDALTETKKYSYGIYKRDGKYLLRFRDKLTVGNIEVQELTYDEANDKFVSDVCTIEGGVPYDLFAQILDKKQRRWEWKQTTKKSEKFAALYDNTVKEFSEIAKSKLQNMCFRVNNNVLTFRIQYSLNNKIVSMDFNFDKDYTPENQCVTFKFVSDFNNASANGRELLPSIQKMVDTLQQQWYVEKDETLFDLSRVKLVSSTDPDMWFVVSLI